MPLKEIDRPAWHATIGVETSKISMQPIEKDELYHHLRGFLKSKGITLDNGIYADGVQHGCNLLTDAINATQHTVARAKIEVDAKLDQLRQSIHEATAPKPPVVPPDRERSTASARARAKGKAKRQARSSANRASAPPSE
jgi:hypothetical protein